jgi:hypothetical protein
MKSNRNYFKTLNPNVYDFCFLTNVHSFNPLTPTLEEGKNVEIDVGVDFSCK